MSNDLNHVWYYPFYCFDNLEVHHWIVPQFVQNIRASKQNNTVVVASQQDFKPRQWTIRDHYSHQTVIKKSD